MLNEPRVSISLAIAVAVGILDTGTAALLNGSDMTALGQRAPGFLVVVLLAVMPGLVLRHGWGKAAGASCLAGIFLAIPGLLNALGLFGYPAGHGPVTRAVFLCLAACLALCVSIAWGARAWLSGREDFLRRLLMCLPWISLVVVLLFWLASSRAASLLPAVTGRRFPPIILAAAILAGVVAFRISGEKTYILTRASLVCAIGLSAWSLLIPRIFRVHEAGSGGRHVVRHVVLITFDTLREDAMASGQLSAFRELASESIVYTQALSPANWTMPSLVSIHTGVPAEVHGFNPEKGVTSEGEVFSYVTLAERLRAAGYATAAFVGNPTVNPSYPALKGFDTAALCPQDASFTAPIERFVAGGTSRPLLPQSVTAREETDDCLAWLRGHEASDFFLWIHFFGPHAPWNPPDEFCPPPLRELRGSKETDVVMNPGRREDFRALYDGEVKELDLQLGRLVAEMRRLDIWKSALVIVTSDHGEEFLEHGGSGHGDNLYEEQLRVPLFIKSPGTRSRGRCNALVETDRIPATVAEVGGLEPPALPGPWGRSLLEEFRDEGARTEDILVSAGSGAGRDRRAVRVGSLKLIDSNGTGARRVYDLQQDPGERYPLRADLDGRLSRIRSAEMKLNEMLIRLRALGKPAVGQSGNSPGLVRQLRALGYLQ